MHILYLHQHFSTPAGSTATRSFAFARALVARGHRVTLATGRYQGAESGLAGPFRKGRREGRVAGFRVVEWDIAYANAMGIAARSAAFLRYAAAAARLALRERPDLIIASSTPLTVALPALCAKALRGIPFIFEIRDPWPELPRAMGVLPAPLAPLMEGLANLACRRAAAVVALSEGMAETAHARGADPARVQVIGNGCDLDLFGPHIAPWRPPEAAPWEVLALYAGAHGRANGLGVVVEAARLLAARGETRLRILLVGEGAEKTALMRAAAELRNITFLPPMPKREIAGLFAGSQMALHILADCPAFAGWTAPNKLMDGLAAGRPVISTAPGDAARLLTEGGAGMAVAPGDAVGLAAALLGLVEEPARRAAMGEAARSLAVRQHDRRLLAARFVALVESVPRAQPVLRKPAHFAMSGRG
ncbi:MAG: glycosyltransferase family 4 protein [Roseomonas sp.]|nr:glycosyltransferase family 4 protein [Roseomonas sp.]MCA3429679.1 glycosyltransferase family 4 protein [Roseomonas sp.]MCA3435675.1 glycosyltransferase family 4 protein [Roseomonas sp.]